MIRSVIFPRAVSGTGDEFGRALELLRGLGFASAEDARKGSGRPIMLAPEGGIQLLSEADSSQLPVIVEVSDAQAAWQIATKLGATVLRDIEDTPEGDRGFELEVAGLRVAIHARAKQSGETRGIEAPLDARGKRFAIVVSRFNSFITERLLDGALQALRQCGADPGGITVVHVPGAFEIPSAGRQLAESRRYDAILCIGCLLRGDTLHYEVIANEVTRGVGQSAQETGVPHAFGVLTCDTLEQAIDRAGLKAGNKGFEAGMAAVEMACLREKVAVHTGAADGTR